MQYNVYDLIIHNWPKLAQTPDKKWHRTWEIVLKSPVIEPVDLVAYSESLSHEDFLVSVEICDGDRLKVSVTTERWGWEDELYSATYNMFEAIDNLFGTIDTIQGQERDLWEPWLRKSWRNSRDELQQQNLEVNSTGNNFGTIDTIQGQERDLWEPWLRKSWRNPRDELQQQNLEVNSMTNNEDNKTTVTKDNYIVGNLNIQGSDNKNSIEGDYNVQGNSNNVSGGEQITATEVVKMLAELEEKIQNFTALPEADRENSTTRLKAAQLEVKESEPDKKSIAKSLKRVNETLNEAGKTTKEVKKLVGELFPTVSKVAGYLGYAVGKIWMMLP
ncbi:hypothetical protein [Okeania sp. SIO3I5]|uniref:hypothetical protein n=1 Tax=Okeania sp. SIO3I5 TaxID=2607805 RepID=UPI0025F63B1A|nr:hypothetical protein [Okeania sp. SIO3I5]